MKYLFNKNVFPVNTGTHRCSGLARHNVNSFTSWPSHVVGPLWLWVQLHCLHLPLICSPLCVHDRSRCDWLPTLCDPQGAEGLIGIFELNTKYPNERYDTILSQSVVNLLQVSLWHFCAWHILFQKLLSCGCLWTISEVAGLCTEGTVSPVTNILWPSFVIVN